MFRSLCFVACLAHDSLADISLPGTAGTAKPGRVPQLLVACPERAEAWTFCLPDVGLAAPPVGSRLKSLPGGPELEVMSVQGARVMTRPRNLSRLTDGPVLVAIGPADEFAKAKLGLPWHRVEPFDIDRDGDTLMDLSVRRKRSCAGDNCTCRSEVWAREDQTWQLLTVGLPYEC